MGGEWARGRGDTSQERDKLVDVLSVSLMVVILGGSEDRGRQTRSIRAAGAEGGGVLVSAGLTCVAQGCGQGAAGRRPVRRWRPLADEQRRHAALRLHGEGVVQVSVQVAHQDPGVRQPRAGRLVVELLAAGLARAPVAALALHAVGDVCPTAGVFGRAPGKEELSRAGGRHEVPRGRGEAWSRSGDAVR